ncbi:hypothetical protein GCM10010172_04420 [Paractinoplanes ferrugineus]|uniref:Uncharacterized protein n=1 Tax=Paractinoplanes ferrugineus TaxID=113564 RepID=A0A919MN20_9ACTN|nr:hypothetical protein Afe05nite_56870 [Actinoplanes ferrugineus]
MPARNDRSQSLNNTAQDSLRTVARRFSIFNVHSRVKGSLTGVATDRVKGSHSGVLTSPS